MKITLRILGVSVIALGACTRTNPGFVFQDEGGAEGRTSSASTSGPGTSESTVTEGGTGMTTTSDGMTATSTDPESSSSGGTGFDGECLGTDKPVVPEPLGIKMWEAGVPLLERPCGNFIDKRWVNVESIDGTVLGLRECDACDGTCNGLEYTMDLKLAGATDYFPGTVEVGDCLNMTAHFAAYRQGEKMCQLSQVGLAISGDPMPLFFASMRMSDEAVAAPELTKWKAFPSLKAELPMLCDCGDCCAKNTYKPGAYSLDMEVRLHTLFKGYPVTTEDIGREAGQYDGQTWKVDVKVVQAYVTGTCAEEPHVQWVARAYPAG
jgi:hypothetical protein